MLDNCVGFCHTAMQVSRNFIFPLLLKPPGEGLLKAGTKHRCTFETGVPLFSLFLSFSPSSLTFILLLLHFVILYISILWIVSV